MAKVNKLSEGSLKVLEIMKASNTGMTVAEIKENGFEGVNSSHLTALKNRGIVESQEVVREVVSVTKRKMNVYTLVELVTEVESEKVEVVEGE